MHKTNVLRKNIHTSSYHCNRRLNVDPLICVDTRVDKYQAVKVRLLTPAECILNGVVVLDGTSGDSA